MSQHLLRAAVALLTTAVALLAGCHKVNHVPWTPVLRTDGVSPAQGPLQGGTVVIVQGMLFEPGAQVLFAGVSAASPAVLDSTRIRCLTPAGVAPGAVDVVVQNPGGGSASVAGAFAYTTWFDTNLPRRLPVTVRGSTAGDLTDWQVRVVVPFDPEMEWDFSDVRFTALSGVTETALPHWVESATAGDEAAFWVKVPSIPAAPGSATVYAYFGNPALAVAPDYDSTFTKDFGETGLAGMWHCDEGTGAAYALDSSGNGNDLELQGTSLPSWQTWDGGWWGALGGPSFASGYSIAFDGVDDRLHCAANATLDPTAALTVEAWVQGQEHSMAGRDRTIAGRWATPSSPFTGPWAAAAPTYAAGGYCGAGFDGRHLYFVPYRNAAGRHGEFLRYDTRAPFSAAGGGWSTFDPGAAGLGTGLTGYAGAVFDGRYFYFPNAAADARVLRFDSQGAFASVSSWTTYDPGSHGVGTDPRGYFGGVFDGRYVYFAPFENESGPHGEVLRYDTAGPFTSVSSWDAMNPGAMGMNTMPASAPVGSVTDPRGYCGALFDSRYVYFVPHARAYPAGQHGEVLRYDVQSEFRSYTSWTSFDPAWSVAPIGTSPRGYSGGVAVGPYIYFAPEFNGSAYHREVLRYDRTQSFTSPTSWQAFSPVSVIVGAGTIGFAGAATDGRYAYFVPCYDGASFHGNVLRYDAGTTTGFNGWGNWTSVDPGTGGLGFALDGFRGAVFDGRYLYLVPAQSAEVARYDPRGGDVSWRLAWSQQQQEGGFSAGPFGIGAVVNTPSGAFTASSNKVDAAAKWFHVAMTYDGVELRLYQNGSLVASRPAPGTVQSSAAGLLLGMNEFARDRLSKFQGAMDEVRVYSRALLAGEILAHAQRRKWVDPEPQASVSGPEERR